ncbi:hypothetical protein [uncultured Roseibium sp.]|uniref:hypothetical protein n=1 Tax=uncultured Roseibium sp. TaxID=1936171 RepID=UPI003217FBDB
MPARGRIEIGLSAHATVVRGKIVSLDLRTIRHRVVAEIALEQRIGAVKQHLGRIDLLGLTVQNHELIGKSRDFIADAATVGAPRIQERACRIIGAAAQDVIEFKTDYKIICHNGRH